MKTRLATTLLTLFAVAAAFSQELRLVVSDQPLNRVVNSLGVEVSFDDSALSPYRISVSRTFRSPEEALEFLLKEKPFEFQLVGNVYVITPKPATRPETGNEPEPRFYRFTGAVYDRQTGEKLPYGYIKVGENTYPTDPAGGFSFRRETADAVRVQVYYLGYHPVDTLISCGHTTVALTADPVRLENVTVVPSPASMMMQAGHSSGEIRINHHVARFMPGSPDNSVFSLLRMMPGVRASGEPSEDLIVWGSGSGESTIVFDGYTLFGMKNYNDHIASVNPYLVKDIRLRKGGYGVDRGGRVGAVSEITGIDGVRSKPVARAMVGNYTANIFASVPITERSVLTTAYRQTFYNLYNEKTYEFSGEGNEDGNAGDATDIYIKPRYSFRDGNLKYAGTTSSNDSYYISLYGADDRFKFAASNEGEYSVDAREKSYQFAGAAGYDKSWNNGNRSTAKASFSMYWTEIDNVTSVGQGADNVLVTTRTDNSIGEIALGLDHSFSLGKTHRLTTGGEWTLYVNHLNYLDKDVSVPSVFVSDDLSLGKFSVTAGLRADFPWDGKPCIQPRISGRYTFTDRITATASWGMYRQFISRIPYQYSTGHYEMVWSLSDSTFMRSSQAVGGLAYGHNGLLVSLEAFWRQTHNGLYLIDNTVFASDNTVVGADIFTKKQFGAHTLFASYSLTNMRKPVRETSHELKVGGLVSLGSFYLSANFVFGSGFANLSAGGHSHREQHGTGTGSGGNDQGNGSGKGGDDGHGHGDGEGNQRAYSRFDVAVTYRLQRDHWRLQAGVSLLNVFDRRNVKYSYRLSNRDNVTNLYTKATPFTPVVFAEILF